MPSHPSSHQTQVWLAALIKEVYPDVNYGVNLSDSIHFLAYNQVNEKQSSIGSTAINIMKQHLNTLKGENAAKDWLCWLLRIDRPLFFKVPSPMGSLIDQKDPRYQFPEGSLLSCFIIDLASPLLNLRVGSASENGYPKGLVALIMGALEHTVRHLSKPAAKLTEFLKESWGSKVRTYYDGFHRKNGMPDACWQELLEICGVCSENNESNIEGDLSILDNDHAFVFNFCSPMKSCT